MKINANSLKIGNLITHNNELWTVVKLNHVKPGKGGAFVQTELKNVKAVSYTHLTLPTRS